MESKRSKSKKASSPKEEKKKDKEDKVKKTDSKTSTGSSETQKLTKDVASLKEKVKAARRAQKDLEAGGMWFLLNSLQFAFLLLPRPATVFVQ